MAHFQNLNSIIGKARVSSGKYSKAAREARSTAALVRKNEHGYKLLKQLVEGTCIVLNHKHEKVVRKMNPQQTLSVLRVLLRCGVTADEIRHVQQAALAADANYVFVANRFPWALASEQILAEFPDHQITAALVLGLTPAGSSSAPTEDEVEAAVTSEPELDVEVVVEEEPEPVAAPKAKRDRKGRRAA